MKSFPFYILLLTAFLPACQWNVQHTRPERKHAIELVQKGGGRMYLDTVRSDRMMHVTEQGTTRFASFLVGVEDHPSSENPKEALIRGKYFQFDFVKDWKVVSKGDSIRPVYYEPRPINRSDVHEGILVFEVPKDAGCDTLIYQDSYGGWGTQTIVFRSTDHQTH